MNNFKILYLIVVLFFSYSCSVDNDLEDAEFSSIENDSLIFVSATTINCPGMNGPSTVMSGTNVSYSIPPFNITNIVWSTSGPNGNTNSNPNMSIFSGQGTRNVVVRFTSQFTSGNLIAKINGVTCTVIKQISKQIPVCINDCGKLYSGYFGSTSTYHIYPDQIINLSCNVATGSTVRLALSPADVPNRFNILDQNNTLVASSNWIGNANYPGPWGPSLFTSGTIYLNFIKSSTSSTYKLRVETATPVNQTDSWGATLNCL